MRNTAKEKGRVSRNKSYYSFQSKYKVFWRNTAYISRFNRRYVATKHIREVIIDIFYFSALIDTSWKQSRKEDNHV